MIAIADPALQFALQYRGELFPGAPIVYSGLAVPDTVDRGESGGVTGVLRGVAYAETLKLALELVVPMRKPKRAALVRTWLVLQLLLLATNRESAAAWV